MFYANFASILNNNIICKGGNFLINLYVDDILKSLECKSYFSALSLALALPDFCGAAEFPDKSVTERYINWYDNYVKNFMSYKSFGASQLSGEVIYNLRNTFLHMGSPNIITSKIKQELNRIDKFTLLLGDATKIQVIFFCVDTPFGSSRAITIDTTFFCKNLCICASNYYEANKDKFQFDFNVIRQENLENEILFKEYTLTQSPNKQLTEKSITDNNSDDSLKQTQEINNPDNTNKTNKKANKAQIISDFISANFTEKKFKNKKQVIIDVILNSKSRTEINNTLTKTFPEGSDMKLIMKRIKPLTKDLFGK